VPELPLTGGCLCGAVRFEVDAPLANASWCHCTRCQRRTGTPASAQGRVEPGSFRVIQGEEHLGAYRPDDGFAKVFCRECGSALWSESPTDPDVKAVRLGAFDADPGIRPGWRQFVAYAAPWDPIPDDGLPRYPERKPA
jgi:hypothetical protein